MALHLGESSALMWFLYAMHNTQRTLYGWKEANAHDDLSAEKGNDDDRVRNGWGGGSVAG